MNPIKSLNPHLFILGGKAAEAIEYYKSKLGAEVVATSYAGEIPGSDFTGDRKKLIANAVLRLGGGMFMVADDLMPPTSGPPRSGSVGAVHVEMADEASLKKAFDAFASDGAQVFCPAGDTFWGAVYGVVMDKYGVTWGFHHDKKGAAAQGGA